MRELDGYGLRPRQVLFNDHDEDTPDPRLDGGLYAVVPGEDFHPAVAQAVAQGTDDSRLSRPMFAVSCWNTSFFSIRAFFLSREMSFGSMTASVRASPYSALLMRESVSFSVEKSMLPHIFKKGYARLSLPRRVPTANPATGRRNCPETAKRLELITVLRFAHEWL